MHVISNIVDLKLSVAVHLELAKRV